MSGIVPDKTYAPRRGEGMRSGFDVVLAAVVAFADKLTVSKSPWVVVPQGSGRPSRSKSLTSWLFEITLGVLAPRLSDRPSSSKSSRPGSADATEVGQRQTFRGDESVAHTAGLESAAMHRLLRPGRRQECAGRDRVLTRY